MNFPSIWEEIFSIADGMLDVFRLEKRTGDPAQASEAIC
jgi:hypothetical protein